MDWEVREGVSLKEMAERRRQEMGDRVRLQQDIGEEETGEGDRCVLEDGRGSIRKEGISCSLISVS